MKKIKADIRKLFTRQQQGRILAVETDDLVIRAADISVRNSRVSVENLYRTDAIDLSSGLEDITRQIRTNGKMPPREALMLSPQVYATVINLPVDPSKELPPDEMKEIIRWELEPYLAQNKGRKIGAILVGRGHLKGKDLEWILSILEKQKESGAETVQRFGEIAVTAGLINRDQLDEALTIQQSSQDFEGEAVTGWIPLPGKPFKGKWRWLAAGVTSGYREHLVKVFSDSGLDLKAVYPLVGSAASCLNGSSGAGNAVFEFHSGFLAYTRVDNQKVSNYHFRFTHEAGNPLRHCFDFFEPDADKVWLAGNWPSLEIASEKISACLERPCHVLSTEEKSERKKMDDAPLLGITGAVRHHTKIADPKSTVRIPAVDPKPPLSKNWIFRITVLLGFATLVMLSFSIAYKQKRIDLEKKIATGKENVAFSKKVSALEANIRKTSTLLHFYTDEIPKRKNLVPGLLEKIKLTCPENIVIDSLKEQENGRIALFGFSTSLRSIRSLRINIDRELPDRSVSDKDYPVELIDNYAGLSGYSFRFDLVPEK